MALAPCLAFACVTAVIVSERAGESAEMIRVEQIAGLGTRISAVIHELQRERGISSLFLGSKGTQFRAELDGQRIRTDALAPDLARIVDAPEIAAYGAAFRRQGHDLAEALARLADQRKAIDGLQAPVAQAGSYYTGLIGTGLAMVGEVSRVAADVRIASRAAAYSVFLSLKEAAGQERAAGSAAFAVGRFDLPAYGRFAALSATQATYANLFRSGTTPAMTALLDAADATDVARQVADLRKQALATAPGEALAFHDAPAWFKLETARIDDLKAIEDRLSADILAAAGDAHAAADRSLMIWALAGLAAVLSSGALAFALGSAIARPLIRMSHALVAIGRGEEDVAIPQHGPREVRAIAQAAEIFRRTVIETRARDERRREEAEERRLNDERIRREAEAAAAEEAATLVVNSIGAALERLSEADLTVEITRPLPPAYEKLRLDLNSAVNQLRSTILIIARNGQGIRSGSGEISSASNDLARRTEQQAVSLEETAAALDEITATVRKTAAGAQHARSAVSGAQADAERSSRIVQDAESAMSAIERSSGEISKIIGVIDEIAFQTNLLALNAGVEAARAGEAGRGFAVVASEVRGLAQRSASAANEIKALIQVSSSQVGAGVQLVRQTGQALARIATQVADINGIVVDMAASAQQQSTALQEVNHAINQMDQVTQQNAAMVEESTAASQSLAQEADNLASLISRFRTGQADKGAYRRIAA